MIPSPYGKPVTNPETIGTEVPSNTHNPYNVNFTSNINTLQPMNEEVNSHNDS